MPPAWLTLDLVHLDRHLAGIPGLERPLTIVIALGRDQVDRLCHALIGHNIGSAQELESP